MPLPAPPANVSAALAAVYATDEDAYNLGGPDFATIVPQSNLMAKGADGVFGSGDLWTLTSATQDFAALGVLRGMVVQLTAPAPAFNPAQYLAVESVGSGSVTLRRCGFPAGVGLPPSPAGGLTAVAFKIATLAPQVEDASFKLNERFAIDPRLAYRTPTDVYDVRIFRRITVLWVYFNQYMHLNRSKSGDFADKVTHYEEMFDEAVAAAVVRWGAVALSQPPTGQFSTKLSR